MSQYKINIMSEGFTDSWRNIVDEGKALGADLDKNYVSKGEKRVNDLSPLVIDGSSIIARAKNSILQFPVYITTSGIRANEAHLISKLLERVYASYVQSVLALHKFQSEEDLRNLAFLKNFHTNLTESTIYHNEYYQPIDELDTIIGESVINSISGMGYPIPLLTILGGHYVI